MLYLLYTIHVIVCLFLILVVLLQQGKGADLSVFGGGGTQTAFGARGAATLLHKLTVFSFIAFIFTTIGIGFLKSGGTSGSVMSDVAEEATDTAMGDPLPLESESAEISATPAEEAPATAEAPAPASEAEPPAAETDGSGD